MCVCVCCPAGRTASVSPLPCDYWLIPSLKCVGGCNLRLCWCVKSSSSPIRRQRRFLWLTRGRRMSRHEGTWNPNQSLPEPLEWNLIQIALPLLSNIAQGLLLKLHNPYCPLHLFQTFAGVSCDSCIKGNFRGLRFKCLICYDYDLCATCYEAGATNTRHTADHPMQCILTRSDYGLDYNNIF